MIYFPARGDATTPRSTNTPRIDRRGIYFPKVVAPWWRPLMSGEVGMSASATPMTVKTRKKRS